MIPMTIPGILLVMELLQVRLVKIIITIIIIISSLKYEGLK